MTFGHQSKKVFKYLFDLHAFRINVSDVSVWILRYLVNLRTL